jgi:glycosyltransferase involved in cell wall biosynthesis
MKISIIIPCYNEETTIGKIVKKINDLNFSDLEIIIIDDFSTDNTRKILKEEIKEKVSKIIFNEKNFGKGFCIKEGIKVSTGDIIIIQDADLEYEPSDYPKLINPIIDGYADVVYGSRFKSTEITRVLFFWHTFGNKILTFLSNCFTNLNLTDMEVCYKAFRSKLIKEIKLEENRFGFEPEITAKISKKNFRIYEVGIKYFGRTYKDGKKINWKDGFSALRCIIKYNLLR